MVLFECSQADVIIHVIIRTVSIVWKTYQYLQS